MKKKILLGLSLLLAMATQANPIFEETFDAPQTRGPEDVGYYEFINTQEGDERTVADGELTFFNSEAVTCKDQPWQRAIKFRNLQIKENQLYRVSIDFQGTNEYLDGENVEKCKARFALMQGEENLDCGFVKDGVEQLTDISNFQDKYEEKGWYRYVGTYFYGNLADQTAWYAEKYPSKDPLPAKYFLTINVYNPGYFYIDRVLIEEVAVSSLEFKDDRIVVDFGLQLDKSQVTATVPYLFQEAQFTVTYNDQPCTIISTELRNDGKVYIFTDGDPFFEEGGTLKVSFTNTNGELKYISGEETKAVSDFADEVGTFNTNLPDSYSYLLEMPTLLSANPADGSFDLDTHMTQFVLNFDKNVDLSQVKATFGNEVLTLKNTEEYAKTLVFERASSDTIKAGNYTLTVSEIYPEFNLLFDEGDVINFDYTFGGVKVAETVYTDLMTVDVQGDNGMASTNWICYRDGEVFEATGGDQRTFAFADGGKFTRGFYLSQRGQTTASLIYGEREGFPFTLPAANVEIKMLVSAWQGNSGNFLYDLIDADGNVVASGSATAEVAQPDQGQVADCSKIAFKVEGCKAGDYKLKITTNTGGFGNAIIIWGLDVKTYVQSEGEKAETEVVIDESFASVGNGNRPAWGSGWNIYGEGGFLDKDGNGLSRIMNLNSCSNMTCGYYNRNLGGGVDPNYCMTYGEDSRKEGVDEPILELAASKYNFTWYACNWKGDQNTYYFAVYDADTWDPATLTGTQVYYREDVITANVNGGGQNAEATKIDFSWTPSKAGRYILKWWMTGESEVGKIKIEKTGSIAVYWHNKVNEAIKETQDALDGVQDEKYAGATRDALAASITKAKTVPFHNQAEAEALINEMAACRVAMKDRVDALASYDAAYNDLANQIAGMAETKWEGLDSYVSGKALVEKYDGVPGYSMQNEELLPVVAELKNTKALNANLMNKSVPAFVDQINRLVSTYNALKDIAYPGEEVSGDLLVAAESALSDDEELVGKLKKLVTATVYKAIANDYEFTKIDELLEETSNPIDLTGFVKNSVFYAFSATNDIPSLENANKAFPGWTFSNLSGSVKPDWGWGGWSGDNNPVAPINASDSKIRTSWNGAYDYEQTITDAPVGTYNVGICGGAGENTGEGKEAVASYLSAENSLGESKQVNFIEAVRETNTVVYVEGLAVDGYLKIGGHLYCPSDFASADNAKLLMSAKDPNFDYAAAAEKAMAEFTTVQQVPVAGKVIATTYYDLNGCQVSAPKGLVIAVQTLEDGSKIVKKVIVL